MRDSRDFAMDGEYTEFTFILLITIEDIVCSSGRCEIPKRGRRLPFFGCRRQRDI